MPHANYPYKDAPRLPLGTDPVDPRVLLNTSSAVELEVGSGRGTFILERLEFGGSDVHMFGLEIKRKWATLVDRRIAARGFGERGRVFAEDARLALPRFPDGCLSSVYVHFPDPWWKKRHQKRLLAGEAFAQDIARLLCAGGSFFVQTDVEERAELYESVFAAHPAFEPWGETATVPDQNFAARSPREKRALEDGLPIHRRRFRRR
jgi:tRNA (guanine-N7-)-methyltransferase